MAELLAIALEELQHQDPADLAVALIGVAETAGDSTVGATLQCAAGVIARESVARQAVCELEIWHASEARLRVVLGDRDFDTAREAGSRLVRSDALALARDALAMQRHV